MQASAEGRPISPVARLYHSLAVQFAGSYNSRDLVTVLRVVLMAIATAAELVAALRQFQLLQLAQLDELARKIEGQNTEARTLAKHLIETGLLSPYQVNQILQDKGKDLVLGSYILLERLGEGGMGQVFKARHKNLDRIAALKLIRKERLENPDAVRRFQREVRAAAQLNHPNVVLAYDADEIGGTHILVMEYIDGATDLSELVKQRGPLPVETACDYIRQAALGLQHAHEHSLVHRDIKPHNLLVTSATAPVPGGERKDDLPNQEGARTPIRPEQGGIRRGGIVKILDMGLARMDSPMADDKSSNTLTQEGSVMGTPDYISPEQAKESHTVDIRGDIYSLGCTFYYLLTGRVPFPGGNLGEKLLKHMMDEPVPVERLRPEVPPAVAGVVRKMMAKKLAERFQNPAEVAAVLQDPDILRPADAATIAGSPAQPRATVAERTLPSSGSNPFARLATSGDTAESQRQQLREGEDRLWRRQTLMGAGILLGLVVLLGIFVWQPWTRTGTNKLTTPVPNPEPVKVAEPENEKEIANSVGIKLRLIPAGTFHMGSPPDEPGRQEDEGPQHDVEITQPFYIGAYEVTQGQYRRVMNAQPSYFKGNWNLPVEQVFWSDAAIFCEKLSNMPDEKKAGRVYRLPTEAEWEYACRAGSKTAFFCDPEPLSLYAWFATNSEKTTHPVGEKKPNAWGLYDMSGNVYEWCSDYYDAGYYKSNLIKDPQGLDKGTARVLRGGSWYHDVGHCRSARRHHQPRTRSSSVGFRVVCELLPPPITNSIGMKLRVIPAGEFTMGSPDTEANREAREGPQHTVKITKPFYIGVFEVKQSEYEKVIGKNPSSFKDPDNPVENVNWDEAMEFCKKLNELPEEKKAGRVYHLPTEAEWEYAARAGTTTVFHYGNSLSSKQANFRGDQPYGGGEPGPNLGKTTKVGSYQPNAWGLYDMHGNVWEWCLDGPRDYPKEPLKEALVDPRGPEAAGGSRLLRGGGYPDEAFLCRSARRTPLAPAQRQRLIGFRVVLSR